MTGVLELRHRLADNPWASEESHAVGQPTLRFLYFGSENGVLTSCTEAEEFFQSDLIEQHFQQLAQTWKGECAYTSSVREMALHPAYQQIVGMGPRALPFIFAELEARPEHWFWALRAITGENPVPPEHQGDILQMAQDWLNWASRRGIR